MMAPDATTDSFVVTVDERGDSGTASDRGMMAHLMSATVAVTDKM